MSTFKGLHIAASGLTAQRFRMDIIASNLANVHTTRTANNEPFRRQLVIFQARQGAVPGVEVVGLQQDPSPFQRVYDPGNPDADGEGYVRLPNINSILEMTDMVSATRSYEANITAIQAIKGMATKALEI
ncbi:MAG: flagellar basal body rod protein FlgC [Cyanobacteria bacterium NC_groundwater_1444_Ag_S-0.65um_54_12]|nr:flagellar basal body rod protein FlgC [Cyanobacteria bacterium NC_groundwater_1444_Ag_S-0.65um_54_12]